MATQVQYIYNEVTQIMLEPGALVLGIITDAMFFNHLRSVIQDFMIRTGCARDIFNITAVSGQTVYNEPCGLGDAFYASFDGNYMYRDSGFSLDQTGAAWYNSFGLPFSWREDELPSSQIQITPAPTYDGNYINLNNQGYGVLSSVASGEMTITATNSGYGTISDASTGDVYADPINEGLGTLFSMVPSTNNLKVIADTTPTRLPTLLTDYIPLVPDSFVPYIKYGILYKIWDTDSEAKDTQRAKYARMRYMEGLSALSPILGEEEDNA